MKKKRVKICYFVLLVVTTLMAIIILNYSMNEPFYVITKVDLIWQLILPSVFLLWPVAGLLIGFLGGVPVRRLTVFFVAMFYLFDLIIFAEAIYGYLWDLGIHAGVK